MDVHTATYDRSGKIHKRYLLRASYRENGKVKKKTIAINPPIKYRIYLLQIASDCNIIFGCQKKKILGNYQ